MRPVLWRRRCPCDRVRMRHQSPSTQARKTMPDFSLHTLDILSIGFYVVVIIAIGFYVARRVGDSTDYFLAGRSLTWSMIGFSPLA